MLEIHINETNIIAGMLPSAHTVLCGVVALIGQQFYATLLSIENKKQIICFGNWLDLILKYSLMYIRPPLWQCLTFIYLYPVLARLQLSLVQCFNSCYFDNRCSSTYLFRFSYINFSKKWHHKRLLVIGALGDSSLLVAMILVYICCWLGFGLDCFDSSVWLKNFPHTFC